MVQTTSNLETMGGMILVLIIVPLIYFIPSIIAYDKKRKQKKAIFTLNLLAAWTIVGWIMCMVWANIEDGDQKTPVPASEN